MFTIWSKKIRRRQSYEQQLHNSMNESKTGQEQPSSSKIDVLKRNAIHSCCAQVRWQRAQHREPEPATERCVTHSVCMKSISKCKHGGSKRLVHRWNTRIYDCKRWQSDKSRISETFQTIPNQSEYKRWVFVARCVDEIARISMKIEVCYLVVLIVHVASTAMTFLCLSKSFVCVFRLPVAFILCHRWWSNLFSDQMQMK